MCYLCTMNIKIPLYVVSVFYNKTSGKIEFWSYDHKILFDYVYGQKYSGQIVEKPFSLCEFHFMRNRVQEVDRDNCGQFKFSRQ